MSVDPSLGPTLLWGLKTSFREYVESVGGSASAEGAALTAAGELAFPIIDSSDFDWEQGVGVLAATGLVTFTAHHGVLTTRVRDLHLDLGPRIGQISATHPAFSTPSDHRVVLAEFDVVARPSLASPWSSPPPRLTFDGTRALGEVYAVGTLVDPIRVVPHRT